MVSFADLFVCGTTFNTKNLKHEQEGGEGDEH